MNGPSPSTGAEAVVQLPQGAALVQKAAYTGAMGTSGQDFTVTRDQAGNTVFTTTRRLKPGEGLTIAPSPGPRVTLPSPARPQKGPVSSTTICPSFTAWSGFWS